MYLYQLQKELIQNGYDGKHSYIYIKFILPDHVDSRKKHVYNIISEKTDDLLHLRSSWICLYLFKRYCMAFCMIYYKFLEALGFSYIFLSTVWHFAYTKCSGLISLIIHT